MSSARGSRYLSRRRYERRHSKPAVVLARRRQARRATRRALSRDRHPCLSRRRNTGDGRPGVATTIIYASLDRPNDKLIALMFAAEALRRGGAKRSRARRAVPVLYAAGYRLSRGRSDQPEGHRPVACAMRRPRRSPSTRICIARRTSGRYFRASNPTISRPCRPYADTLRKAGLDPATVVVGPDAESLPWVSDLAGRLGLSYDRREKDPPRRPFGRDRISGCRTCIAGRPALIVDDIVSSGGTMIACAKALTAAGATAIDAVVTHALFLEAAATRWFHRGFARSVRHRAYRISPMPSCSMICSSMP